MKFDQIIKYNRRNIFIEESYTKYGEKASPRPFHKKINSEYIFGSIVWDVSMSMSNYRSTKIYWN